MGEFCWLQACSQKTSHNLWPEFLKFNIQRIVWLKSHEGSWSGGSLIPANLTVGMHSLYYVIGCLRLQLEWKLRGVVVYRLLLKVGNIKVRATLRTVQLVWKTCYPTWDSPPGLPGFHWFPWVLTSGGGLCNSCLVQHTACRRKDKTMIHVSLTGWCWHGQAW